MTDQWLNGAVHTNIAHSSTRNRLDNALDNMKQQMNTYSSTYSYGEYTPDDHGWDASPSKSDASSEEEYLEDFAANVAQAHRNGEITAVHGDTWIVIDGFDVDYGYGRAIGSVYVDLDGDGNLTEKIWVARAASMEHSSSGDPHRVTKNTTMHETAHLFGADHKDGDYDLTSNNYIKSASPMATHYVRDAYDDPDTCFGGTGTQVDDFCVISNDTYQGYCHACDDWCRHRYDMQSCTKYDIENSTPLG